MKTASMDAANLSEIPADRNPRVKISSREIRGDDSRTWFVRPIWQDHTEKAFKLRLAEHPLGDPADLNTHFELEILPRKMRQFLGACKARNLSIAAILGGAVAEVMAEIIDVARAVGDIPPVQKANGYPGIQTTAPVCARGENVPNWGQAEPIGSVDTVVPESSEEGSAE